jgi:hypothetical protein
LIFSIYRLIFVESTEHSIAPHCKNQIQKKKQVTLKVQVDFVENQRLRMEDYGLGMTILNILSDDITLLCEDLKPKVIIYPSTHTSGLP